jgi:ribosomal protein S18 acetylase RimI-like enzyme
MTTPAAEEQENARLIRLIDANLVAFGRHMARVTIGAVAAQSDGVLLVDGAAATLANAAIVTGTGGDPSAVLPAAARFFAARGHGYGIWTRAHADAVLEAVLPAAGFAAMIDLPVMVLTEPPPARALPVGVEVRRVVDASGVSDFRSVDGVDPDDRPPGGVATASLFADPASLLAQEVAGFVAYRRALPVAAAMSFTHGEVSRVGWVETIPAHRRRGLGDAVTRAAVLAGFDMGARIAVLESSPMGASMYRSMGFREITRYRVWIAR